LNNFGCGNFNITISVPFHLKHPPTNSLSLSSTKTGIQNNVVRLVEGKLQESKLVGGFNPSE
jgi:hypothetical protein